MQDEIKESQLKLYNKATIIIFSLLLSTFFGGVIYSRNLSQIGERKQIAPVLFFCLIWNLILFKIANKLTSDLLLSFIIPNLLGSLVITTLFWKHHFKEISFKSKNIWMPLIVVFIVYGIFICLLFFKR
ncbi:hypothetical protein ACFOG5_10205 [Pedobacter fastidiosus]|uniref:Integral membrane protein n=1 Tax=Pedobacter fastidiosus TaxID=2765361 RepID=A0ABR7KWA1_9SPHI|nr:hypothetical protein [Pedobacter fastidiosus]MBC6112391.1 hypothetical protein [Pedobacter fastidiosus]